MLASLGTAASNLRQKLGESLSSIQKYDVKIEQATTSSLEALKAYAMGDEERTKGRSRESLVFYKRAVDLDHLARQPEPAPADHLSDVGDRHQLRRQTVEASAARGADPQPDRDRCMGHALDEPFHLGVGGDRAAGIQHRDVEQVTVVRLRSPGQTRAWLAGATVGA